MAEIDILGQTQASNARSDDSDHDVNCGNNVPELRGYLSKWTNYIHGWQPRFIVLKDGTLSYYKRYEVLCPCPLPMHAHHFEKCFPSEIESDYGCRGAISLDKATIKVANKTFAVLFRKHFQLNANYRLLQSHEFDECRFDVCVNNCVWYLRAENSEDKTHWVDVLQSYRALSSAEMNNLCRHGSSISLQSNSASIPISSSTSLRDKINEIDTCKDILANQLSTLQK